MVCISVRVLYRCLQAVSVCLGYMCGFAQIHAGVCGGMVLSVSLCESLYFCVVLCCECVYVVWVFVACLRSDCRSVVCLCDAACEDVATLHVSVCVRIVGGP